MGTGFVTNGFWFVGFYKLENSNKLCFDMLFWCAVSQAPRLLAWRVLWCGGGFPAVEAPLRFSRSEAVAAVSAGLDHWLIVSPTCPGAWGCSSLEAGLGTSPGWPAQSLAFQELCCSLWLCWGAIQSKCWGLGSFGREMPILALWKKANSGGGHQCPKAPSMR